MPTRAGCWASKNLTSPKRERGMIASSLARASGWRKSSSEAKDSRRGAAEDLRALGVVQVPEIRAHPIVLALIAARRLETAAVHHPFRAERSRQLFDDRRGI